MGNTTKHKSTNGATAYAIESFINFLTGERPLRYKWANKNHNFFMSNTVLGNQKYDAILKVFAKEYSIGIYSIDEFENVT